MTGNTSHASLFPEDSNSGNAMNCKHGLLVKKSSYFYLQSIPNQSLLSLRIAADKW